MGDWISTSPIFNALTKDYKLYSSRKIAEVIFINKDGIGIKCWNMEGKEIMHRGIIDKEEKIFLLEDDETLDIKKRLILHNLK